jgi:hypothetical protein
MAALQFKNIALEPSKVATALTDAGVEGLKEQQINQGKLTQYSGAFQGKPFLIQLFANANGKCTVGHSTGFDVETFNHLAQVIVSACRIGSASPLNVSLPKFSKDNVQLLIDYLVEQGASVTADESHGVYRQLRIVGPLRDALTIKAFNNGTLQLQGSHVQVAGWALDLVQTLLPLDKVLEHQKAVYEVPLTVEQIKEDLEVRIPYVHDSLDEAVQVQLSASLALTKVGVALGDYAAVAFNALRGLEGYCFQLLTEEVGLTLKANTKLGDFFDDQGSELRLLSTYHNSASPPVQGALVKCYKLWHSKRHRLFHMDGTTETTRILDNHAQAVSIVDEVLSAIEESHRDIQRTKEET